MGESYTCPRCGRTSHNPNDARYRYCGACHQFETTSGADVIAITDELADVMSVALNGVGSPELEDHARAVLDAYDRLRAVVGHPIGAGDG